MDAEDFELAVAVIILLRRVRRKMFKRTLRKQWVCAIFKDRKGKCTYDQLIRENFDH